MTDDPSLHSLNSKDVWLLVRGISSISTLPLTRVASSLLCCFVFEWGDQNLIIKLPVIVFINVNFGQSLAHGLTILYS